MNYITETFNPTSSDVPKSPACDRWFLEDVESPTIRCGSWKSRMFAKVKECRDALKSMIAFEKPPATNEAALSNDANSSEGFNFFVDTGTTFASSASNSDAPESRNKRILIRTSTLNSNEMRELNAMIERIDEDTYNPNNSSDDCLDNTTSSSLRSFLALERRVAEEFSEEDAAAMIAAATAACANKKKISAEPFLSYAQGSAEFVWSEDTEDSVSEKAWNSLERSNSSDIAFDNPRTSSTLCEYSDGTDKCLTSIRKAALQDSGFETNSI